MLGSAHASSVY